MKHRIALGPVQETLLIPLYARAIETRKAKPILVDHKAVEIVESLDFDFSKFAGSKRTWFGVCMRGIQFDAWVRSFLEQSPNGTIVELGAGLNTRFERVDNGRARWFDLDLPDSMELRRQFFAESERRRFLSTSMLDTEWMKTVQETGGPYLFTTEGVLMYFSESDVERLFQRLASYFPQGLIAFDSITSTMKTVSDPALAKARGQFRWFLDDPSTVEGWNSRFRFADQVDMAEIARRNRRTLPLSLLIMGKIYSLFNRKLAKSYHLHLLRFSETNT